MYKLSVNQKKIIKYLLLLLICLVLYFISKQSYNLFYTATEIAIVVLGFTLMISALSTIKICENNYFHFLAIIFGIISIINFLYLLAYRGVDIFSKDYNKWVQFNIFTEYYECIMLNLSVLYINKKFNWYKTLIKNTFVIVLIILGIIVFEVFPACYVEGHGRTLFHQVSKLLFFLCFVIVLIRVMKSKAEILNENKSGLLTAIFLKILSCLTLTLYNNDYTMLIVVGHLFKFMAYYYIFKVMFRDMVINPYTILSKKLKKKAKELESVNKELDKANYKAKSIENLNEKFINLIPDGILVVRNRIIESANKRFLNMLEIEDENELINKNFSEIIDTSYHEIFAARIDKMEGSILERPQEYQFVWGKKKKWVEVTSLILMMKVENMLFQQYEILKIEKS